MRIERTPAPTMHTVSAQHNGLGARPGRARRRMPVYRPLLAFAVLLAGWSLAVSAETGREGNVRAHEPRFEPLIERLSHHQVAAPRGNVNLRAKRPRFEPLIERLSHHKVAGPRENATLKEHEPRFEPLIDRLSAHELTRLRDDRELKRTKPRFGPLTKRLSPHRLVYPREF